MGFGDLINKAKTAAQDFQENRQEKAAEEEARKQAILDGHISPIQTTMALKPGETAYLQLSAKRKALVDKIVEHTVGKTKRKNVVGRAIVGGILTGGIGVIAGAATAGKKTNTTTTQSTETSIEDVDKGIMIITNQRIVFIGNNVISLPYDQIFGFQFKHGLTGSNKVAIKYTGMMKGEFFELSGDGSKDTELYYQGVKQHLI